LCIARKFQLFLVHFHLFIIFSFVKEPITQAEFVDDSAELGREMGTCLGGTGWEQLSNAWGWDGARNVFSDAAKVTGQRFCKHSQVWADYHSHVTIGKNIHHTVLHTVHKLLQKCLEFCQYQRFT